MGKEKPIDWCRFYSQKEVRSRLAAGWEPLMLEYESVDGGIPEPSPYRIVYGWKRYVDEKPTEYHVCLRELENMRRDAENMAVNSRTNDYAARRVDELSGWGTIERARSLREKSEK